MRGVFAAILATAVVNSSMGKPREDDRLDTILDLAPAAGLAKTVNALTTLLDEQIAFAPLGGEAFVEPAAWLRLARVARGLPADQEASLFASFRAHDAFAHELAFLYSAGKDKPKAVAELARRLIAERPSDVDRFPALAAAVCVVFDEPRTWEFGVAPDALAAFDHFTSNDARLAVSTRETPAELLVFVADVLAPPADLAWALDKYAMDRRVGVRYAQVPYDTGHFPKGGPLKLASVEPSLANMLKVGGVCRHQAHYAAQTGKAQGIPTAVITAGGSVVGHAWLGFLELSTSSASWNFDAGRFGEYSETTGMVRNPQTGEAHPDGRLALAARAALEPPAARRRAAALTDAALRLADPKAPTFDPFPPAGVTSPPREAGVATRLAMLEAAIRECPAYADAWDAAAAMAEKGELDRSAITTWAEAAVTFCGHDYPDFAVDVLAPLIRSLKDPPEQSKLWDWAFAQFSGARPSAGKRAGPKPPPKRADLAARIRFEQARMWENAGDPAKAWDAYTDVIDRFPNNGSYIVDAAARCEQLLAREDKPADDALRLYARAFAAVKRPPPTTSPEFLAFASHTRLGTRYATLLEKAGKDAEADKIRRQLPAPPKKSR